MLRRRHTTPTGLPLHVVDFLIGYTRPPQDITDLQAAGVPYDEWFQFEDHVTSALDTAQLWRLHGAQIRREAAAVGIDLKARGLDPDATDDPE